MKIEISKFIPTKYSKFITEDDNYIIRVEKLNDLIRLKDVLDFYNGEIPKKHAIWIISSLYNICNYIEYSNLSHNDINIDSIYISPEYHGVWWFIIKNNSSLIGMSSIIYNNISKYLIEDKVGNIKIDLELIKYILKTILGPNIKSINPIIHI